MSVSESQAKFIFDHSHWGIPRLVNVLGVTPAEVSLVRQRGYVTDENGSKKRYTPWAVKAGRWAPTPPSSVYVPAVKSPSPVKAKVPPVAPIPPPAKVRVVEPPGVVFCAMASCFKPQKRHGFCEDHQTPTGKKTNEPAVESDEPVVGFRMWVLEPDYAAGGANGLKATAADVFWKAEEIASCNPAHADAGWLHEAPFDGCDCGIHAYKNKAQILNRIGAGSPRYVVGAILLTGRTLEHEEGYRGQKARIIALSAPTPNRYDVPDLPEIGKRLGVPVVPIETLDVYAEEFGKIRRNECPYWEHAEMARDPRVANCWRCSRELASLRPTAKGAA